VQRFFRLLLFEKTLRLLRQILPIPTWHKKNNNMNPFPENSHHCLHHLLESQAIQYPEALALTFEGNHLSYQELDKWANRLAHHLCALGVKPETLVALCAERSLELVVGLLAVLKSGGAYVPLDPDYPADRLDFILEDTQAPIILTQGKGASAFRRQGQMVVDLNDLTLLQHYPDTPPAVSVSTDTLAYVMYTSGSTGQPKGVLIEHRNVLALLHGFEQAAPHATPLNGTWIVPIGFDVSVLEIFSQLCYGGNLHILRRETFQDPAQLAGYLIRHTITSAYLPPALLEPVIGELRKHGHNPLRRLLVGVEPIAQQTLQAYRDLTPEMHILNGYGPTEATVCATFFNFVKASDLERRTPIGKPLVNYQVYVLNDKNQLVADGDIGELCIAGAGLARGYLKRPELTAERFVANPFGNGQLYRSGDQGRRLPDGNLEFLGRTDHQVKVRGFRVELGEIETVLNRHPEVRQSVVIARPHLSGHSRLIAYVIPRIAEATPEQDIVQQWRQIMDEAYGQSTTHDPTLHTGGWVDSYHGSKPMPAAEVQEWVDHSVNSILALKPRRVLEIGCGTGMLLFRIAPSCECYLGTDLSPEGIRYLKSQVEQAESLVGTAVELLACPADEVANSVACLNSATVSPPFDTVIINSVIQYFPGIRYMVKVVEDLLPMLSKDARIFIGDVVSYPLLEAFHTSVQLHQASDTLTTADLRRQIALRMAHEQRLMIAPTFFTALQQYFPTMSWADIQLKPGRAMNELTRFRYDVTLYVGASGAFSHVKEQCIDWRRDGIPPTPELICQHLEELTPLSLRITHIPNPRTWNDIQAVALLARLDAPTTVSELRHQIQTPFSVEPDAWRDLQQSVPYQVSVHWSGDGASGEYEVLFQRRSDITSAPALTKSASGVPDWQTFANPVGEAAPPEEWLGATLRSFLRQKLPDYMMPSAFVFLEAFPSTSNGKIDRQALPEPSHTLTTTAIDCYVAPRTETELWLAEIWEDTLNVSPISVEDSFFDLGGHSLLLVQLLARIRETIAPDLPLATLFAHPTIAGLAAILEGSAQSHIGASLMPMSVEELQVRVVLDTAIRPSQPSSIALSPLHTVTGVFLTGASGFLGAYVLNELLQGTQATIYCLVRCKDVAAGWQRLTDNLTRYQLGHLITNKDYVARIVPIVGDLERPLLGLDAQHFEKLAQAIELIYHVGAAVNILYPYAAVEAANVGGTQEILRLAAHGKLKAVHYISSVGVFEASGYVGQETLYENEDMTAAGNIYGGYAQSKWVSEQLIHIARQRGMPVVIYRLGGITAHSQTGAANVDDLLARLIKLFVEQGKAPYLDAPVDFSPVDYISRAIVQLSGQPESLGSVFHLTNPQPTRWTTVVETLRDLGHQIQDVPYAAWLETLQAAAELEQETALGVLLPLLAEKLPKTEQSDGHSYFDISSMMRTFDCQNTLAGLASSGLTCPSVDANLLRKTLMPYVGTGA